MLMLCQEEKQENFLKNYRQEDYIFEIKFDGERALFYIENFKISKIKNRRGNDILKQFVEFKDLLFNIKSGVIDGEIIVSNGKEAGDFNSGLAFRSHLKNEQEIKERSERLRAKIMAFDILFKEGEDLRYKPLLKRKEALRTSFNDNDLIENVKYSVDFKQLWDYVLSKDIEGIIAKHKAVAYEDIRSKYWIKIKNWKEMIVEFDNFEVVNSSENYYKGITLTNKEGLRCACLGRKSEEVRQELEQKGKIKVICQYLEKTEKNNRLRFITFKELVR